MCTQNLKFLALPVPEIIGCIKKLGICDFLLVRNSNLGPILHRFGATARFMCSCTHPYSTLILGCSRYQRAHGP